MIDISTYFTLLVVPMDTLVFICCHLPSYLYLLKKWSSKTYKYRKLCFSVYVLVLSSLVWDILSCDVEYSIHKRLTI